MYRLVLSCFLKGVREEGCTKIIRKKHSQQWEHEKQKTDLCKRRVKLWNGMKITTTLTEPGIRRTSVGREIWSKILGNNSVKKLVNKCD